MYYSKKDVIYEELDDIGYFEYFPGYYDGRL